MIELTSILFGGSGSGKSSILRELGDIKQVKFDDNKSLISNFDWMEPNEVALLLIGLSSIPTWLRPFMEWLMPDWIYSLQKGGVLERGDWLRQGRPKIALQVHRVESDTWNIFKKHHYLTEDINKSCKFFLFEWNTKPVAIVAAINQPGKNRNNAMALSRTVVLPEYQGMGIGSKISEFCAAILVSGNCRVFTKTINPALGIYRSKSDKWRPTSKNGIVRMDIESDRKAKNRLKRISYCYEYIGESIDGYESLLLPINEIRLLKKNVTIT